MGLEFIREKNQKYVQTRDSNRAMTDVSDLLERINPDRVRELFGADLRDKSICLEPGYRALVRFESETSATIHQNGCVIGDLNPSDALELSKRLQGNGKTSGMFEVLIRERQDISGHFKIMAAEPKDIRDQDHGTED